jgi:hypothetical protein
MMPKYDALEIVVELQTLGIFYTAEMCRAKVLGHDAEAKKLEEKILELGQMVLALDKHGREALR